MEVRLLSKSEAIVLEAKVSAAKEGRGRVAERVDLFRILIYTTEHPKWLTTYKMILKNH